MSVTQATYAQNDVAEAVGILLLIRIVSLIIII